MGVGKSTVGPILARFLNFEFVDLDVRIQNRIGMTVPEIFSKKGETFFRDLETQELGQISAGTIPIVIALGGGTLLRAENRERVRDSGVLIYLRASLDVLQKRVRNSDRPLLVGSGKSAERAFANKVESDFQTSNLQILFDARKPFYEEASFWIESEGSPEEVARAILSRLLLNEYSRKDF